ncbi:MAG: primosomal protein N' [Alphaproteobacteria bacterium]|jgi:primosomal protein N' (replication factor Y)|nr:primosomal protein N' [Alphaproteobacteria bacterium]
MKIYDVIVPLALNSSFSYKSEESLLAGDLINVSFGRQKVTALVIGESTSTYNKLKNISIKHNLNIGEDNLKFIKWISNYTLSPVGLIFKSFISSASLNKSNKTISKYSLSDDWKEEFKSITKTQSRVKTIELIKSKERLTAKEIMEELSVGDSVIKGLLKANVLKEEKQIRELNFPKPDLTISGKELSEDQKKATSKLLDNIGDDFSVSLIDGITGSGKTEVYFEAISEVLAKGKQVLIMLPEISLSGGFIERFEHRFGIKPYVWHSSISPAQKGKTWKGIISGKAKVIVGARSSLLLPYKDLGLIVVDEEHDNSYKQEDVFMYNARDMAVVRANIGKFPCVLVSAAPSLESVYNCEQEKYFHIELKSRYGEAKLPDIKLIDMKDEKTATQEFLSDTLRTAIKNNFDQQEQTLLFLNRRGYSPLVICKKCGERLSCPYCTSWLTSHKRFNKLMCHQCGFEKKLPESCPSCNEKDSFVMCGPGVEKIAEEVKSLIPEARLITVSSDLTNNNLQSVIKEIEQHKYDIIVGTQMISKGHNFPKLTLVGIVDGDIASADLRAGEKNFQLIQQVSGRAGRHDLPGRVLIQTYEADTVLMQALENNDKEAFLEEEKALRADRNLPPYGKLASLIVSCNDENLLNQACRELSSHIPKTEGIIILGPAEAPIYRLRGKYRKRYLIKIDKNKNAQKTLQFWINSSNIDKRVRVQIDIDPYSFY